MPSADLLRAVVTDRAIAMVNDPRLPDEAQAEVRAILDAAPTASFSELVGMAAQLDALEALYIDGNPLPEGLVAPPSE